MKFKEAIDSYEQWIKSLTTVYENDLALKHEKMLENPFNFLRATYFRWAQNFHHICGQYKHGTEVLSVGDLHIENFGTWRDEEGRLIWGINDFEEASRLPFTNDLIRLVVSAFLAIDEKHLEINKKEACKAILKGYKNGMSQGGKPYVLEENHNWLRKIAINKLQEPKGFWADLKKLIPIDSRKDDIEAIYLLKNLLPKAQNTKISHRVAGLGSLGLSRYIILGQYGGGNICREIKAIIPPAQYWIKETQFNTNNYKEIISKAIRCIDPFVQILDKWLVRRLSPHCGKIYLHMIPKKTDATKLLIAMGFETANIHLGSIDKAEVLKQLKNFHRNWLYTSAKIMEEYTIKEWEEYKSSKK